MDRQTKEATVADLRTRFTRASAAVRDRVQGLDGPGNEQSAAGVERRRRRIPRREEHPAELGHQRYAVRFAQRVAVRAERLGIRLRRGRRRAGEGAGPVCRRERKTDHQGRGSPRGSSSKTAGVKALATLPGRDALRAQLLGVLAQPATRLVSSLSANRLAARPAAERTRRATRTRRRRLTRTRTIRRKEERMALTERENGRTGRCAVRPDHSRSIQNWSRNWKTSGA